LISIHRWKDNSTGEKANEKEKASSNEGESKRVLELQELLVHQKESSDSLLARQEAIIDQLHSALESINKEISSQQQRFEEEMRRMSDEARVEVEGLRGRLTQTETEKSTLQLTLEDLSARVESQSKQLETY